MMIPPPVCIDASTTTPRGSSSRHDTTTMMTEEMMSSKTREAMRIISLALDIIDGNDIEDDTFWRGGMNTSLSFLPPTPRPPQRRRQ